MKHKLDEIVESPISKYLMELGFSEKELVTALIDARSEEMNDDFLRMLLTTKFSYFDKFSWEIYVPQGFREWEIYLTNPEEPVVDVNKSVYVPVKALLVNNSQMIINHTKQYFSQYRAGRNPNIKKHDHNTRNQLTFTCPVCQQARYEKDILPLQGKEFMKLKEEMKNE